MSAEGCAECGNLGVLCPHCLGSLRVTRGRVDETSEVFLCNRCDRGWRPPFWTSMYAADPETVGPVLCANRTHAKRRAR